MSIPIVAFVGRSGSGKTTLLVQVIAELARRGYRVATIKHYRHSDLQVDQPGKDSWRHAQAGSRHAIIAAPDKVASVRVLDRELSLEEVAAGISDVDVILVEGYKQAEVPAIDVVRAANSPDAVGRPAYRIALVTDTDLDLGVPRYSLDDAGGVADLIETRFLTGAASRHEVHQAGGSPAERAGDGTQRISIPVVCIVGRSKSGRTTLIEKLVRELKRRGYRVGTVKHHSHPGFELDKPGKDTWRHAQAGSDHVVISTPDKIASIRRVERELELDEIAATMTDVDVILTEGYLRAGRYRIEVVRAERSTEPICLPDDLLALASDVDVPYNLPRFGLDDTAGLADLIEGLM